MKILRVVPFPPDYIGGLPFYCKNISINLSRKKNVKCDILTSDLTGKYKKIEYLDENIRIVYNKCYSFLLGKNPLIYILPFIKDHYEEYDIIHAHGYYFFSTLQCALLKKIKDFPFIIHTHGGIQTPYCLDLNIYENLQLIFKEKLFDRTIGKYTFRLADIIISGAESDLYTLRKRYKIKEEKSFYIPDGVDVNKFKRNDKIKREYITLLATRFSYIKGIDIYIEIIKELYKKNKNLKFLIIGKGELENLVLDAKKKLPLKHYSYYPYENIQDIYNMSKLLLVTSRFEGIPNVIHESLACQTPVVSSDVGGISGIISHNENGYLYNIRNYKSAIDLILELVKDKHKLEEFGRNGRRLIEKEYSWEVVTDKVYNIYKKLLKLYS